MALYQNTSVDSDLLTLGNFKIESGASAGATMVNVGAGMLNDIQHSIEKIDVQAGNAPDPIEGISRETVTFTFDMIELDMSVISALSGGLYESSVTTSISSLKAGGQTTLTKRAFKFTNRRLVSGATKETVITVFSATLQNGFTWATKSDNDADPINVVTFDIVGELDTSLSVGSQLFTVDKDN